MLRLDTDFTRLVGCRYPLQQAAMGGFTSPDLAIAVSRAGGFGMLSATVGGESLSAQLDAVPSAATVGVNFLVPFLDRRALEEAAGRTLLIEFFWGTPDAELVAIAHAGNAMVGWQIGSRDEARAAQDAGCDLVIAQGIEAGGHVRGTSGLLALIDEVRPVIDVPLVAAGGIGTGRSIAAAIIAGADGVRIGTRFLAAAESVAHPTYIAKLIESTADDTILTSVFCDGWPDAPHRVLRSAVAAGLSRGTAQNWTTMWPTTNDRGPIESRALYAGQSVGAVRSRQPAEMIVAELIEQAEQAFSRGPHRS